MGGGTAVMAEDLHGRVTIIETKLESMMLGISELTKAVRAISDQPRPLPLKEVGAAILMCFGLFAYVDSYVDSRISRQAESLKYRIAEVEKKIVVTK
jgi:hypothetical protein